MLTPSHAGAAQTEAAIVRVARALLAEGGAGTCSMRAVAEGSGITAAAIYKHFRDKAALIDHVVGLSFQAFERSLLDAIAPLPPGSFARLAALGEAYIRFAEEHQEEFKVLFMPLSSGRKKLSDVPGEGGYRVLRQCVVEAIEAGSIRDADPDLVAFYLWSRVHGIVMLLLACDFGEVIEAEGGPHSLNLFGLTRSFVVSGLSA
jgi:AcrR family transcriptional regulator